MTEKEFPYSHIQHFQISDKPEDIEEKVKSFLECGWLYVGQVTIAKQLFECVVWERIKGEPIYPSDYLTNTK
ncbi:hypothetical protein NSA56_01715 [Oceanobacillus caeni]|uniref:DUF1737 domain-containing protein n=1 Tax=Oceanobacillus caeni TaxID=405946 RepID=A0ABR5MK45_9BACI|nr:hypothetical protein [Oceanobacillus caeni]KPH76101.1 hypothetical protein AFL42_07340 [Oceanobacillus caeni]MCR1833113.1 hypothetical protein [Oceanobacillus caeni]